MDIGQWSIVVKNAKERLPQLNKKLKNDNKNPIEDQISIQYSAWDFGGQVFIILYIFNFSSVLKIFLFRNYFIPPTSFSYQVDQCI